MACLGSVLYDPGTLATASTASLLAMTAFDTTNARITFTAPASGNVLIRIRASGKGATTVPVTLLGVLDGATVKGRQIPFHSEKGVAGTASLIPRESSFVVTGLTPSNSYTWDAAYGVEIVVASTQYGWGGPNDTTASNAYGALSYEVWDAANLLAGTLYDPSVAVTASTASQLAMTALDTTNLRLSFTVPASGRVLVRQRCAGTGAATVPIVHFGCLEGATLRGRSPGICVMNGGATATFSFHSEYVVSGLTPAANLTWDAAYAVETVLASTTLNYGGPNDTTTNNAWGGYAYEIWKA